VQRILAERAEILNPRASPTLTPVTSNTPQVDDSKARRASSSMSSGRVADAREHALDRHPSSALLGRSSQEPLEVPAATKRASVESTPRGKTVCGGRPEELAPAQLELAGDRGRAQRDLEQLLERAID